MKGNALILALLAVLLLVSLVIVLVNDAPDGTAEFAFLAPNPFDARYYNYLNPGSAAEQHNQTNGSQNIPVVSVSFPQDGLEMNATSAPEYPTGNETALPENTMPEDISIEFKLVRKLEIENAAYPSILFANNRFYVSFESGGDIYVKTYSSDFGIVQDRLRIASPRSMDHAMVFGDGYFYLADSFRLTKFDSELREVKSVSLIDMLPLQLRANQPFGIKDLDDVLFYYANGTVYLGIGFNDPSFNKEKEDSWTDNLYIQQYDSGLRLNSNATLRDIGVAGGSSMLLENGTFTIVSGDRHYDDSSLVATIYDANFSFIERKTISAAAAANEEFATGFLSDNGVYYVAYYHITGDISKPTVTEPVFHTDIMLKAFDSGWNFLGEAKVTDDVPYYVRGHFGMPRLSIVNSRIYVSYESHEAGMAKVFVKEYEILSVQ